ncbi:MAG: peptide-methionine (S)-S-oxide reductase [Verrucomicrobia bacterium]|nr:peptide-methionine (S)-S-oxide reductase [Verrucomicrobiota bacterium]|tara:strand:- start:433 stop:963 length:531 start_codon:yes stop_codon:yes gene_type:complete
MIRKATFGSGCFWCTEGIFKQLKGVRRVTSGYSGGLRKNPTYEQVCSGATGHAEVVQIEFDDDVIKFAQLLEVFWNTHDPTTLNRQGADVGTQYRSVVFYHDSIQKETALAIKQALDDSDAFGNKIVTEISPIENFYPAEDYHQDYYKNNPDKGYCQMVVRPKIEKFQKVFREYIQ